MSDLFGHLRLGPRSRVFVGEEANRIYAQMVDHIVEVACNHGDGFLAMFFRKHFDGSAEAGIYFMPSLSGSFEAELLYCQIERDWEVDDIVKMFYHACLLKNLEVKKVESVLA
jgi:hypothetical protein